ncbi:kelch-like protein 10 [Cylas formicarius]|uniref:kelch-like protein 10 n=1 Tax=Cylas formicarius TaxID=197179 RepID=UPI002958C5DA|nr:kelch-like protein 10 [Cylas formicarius]
MSIQLKMRKKSLGVWLMRINDKKKIRTGQKKTKFHRKECNCQHGPNKKLEFPTIWEQLRINQQLCDGTVRCDDGVEFKIHRIILCTVSPYFKALFTNSINRGQPEIQEANVSISSDAFKVVLDYAYTGNCVINNANVFEVLQHADKYEILDVVQECCRFLINELAPGNCLQIIKFASQYFCRYLVDAGNMFVLRHFNEVLRENDEYRNMSGAQLRSFLADDYLNVKSEDSVFDAIQTWFAHCPEERKSCLYDLLKCIRMGNLCYESIVEMARWTPIEEDTRCTIYMTDVLTILDEQFDNVNFVNYMNRPRVPYDVVFAVGGWSAGSPTNFVEIYDNRAERWLVSKDTDVVARAYHGMCTYNNKIYLVGGFDGNEYFNTVRCFDPVRHAWTDCACMYYSRCYVSVAYLRSHIYALGGYNGRIRMNSAEKYDPIKNQWELIPSMIYPRSDASAAVLNDKIYIVGGFNGQEVMNSAEMFDPDTNQWTIISFMITARSGVNLVSFKDSLYAIGGFNGYTRLTSSEKFTPDVSSDWTEISEMEVPRSNFGTVILDGYIYVIGGFNGSTTINSVEYYDTVADEWDNAVSMNLNRSALSACVLSGLPNSKDYSLLHFREKNRDDSANA